MFRDAEKTIDWALDMKCKMIIDGSATNRMCGKQNPTTLNDLIRGLSPQEAHLQAEMIYRIVEDITDPACKQYLLAKHNLTDKIDDVMNRVFARLLYSGGIYRRDVSKVVLKYMGVQYTKDEIRESLKCDRNKVDDFMGKVYDIMDDIHYNAINEVENKMMNAGLVARRDVVNA